MARSLYMSGTGLQGIGGVVYRRAFLVGGAHGIMRIDNYAAALAYHNHYEVSPDGNGDYPGVAGSWWLATGTTSSAAWNGYGGGEDLWWKPDNGPAYQVVEGGKSIVRPSQIFWWIPAAGIADAGLVPGIKSGQVHEKLNRYEGPVNAPH